MGREEKWVEGDYMLTHSHLTRLPPIFYAQIEFWQTSVNCAYCNIFFLPLRLLSQTSGAEGVLGEKTHTSFLVSEFSKQDPVRA